MKCLYRRETQLMRMTTEVHVVESGSPLCAKVTFSWVAEPQARTSSWVTVSHGYVARSPEFQIKLQTRE